MYMPELKFHGIIQDLGRSLLAFHERNRQFWRDELATALTVHPNDVTLLFGLCFEWGTVKASLKFDKGLFFGCAGRYKRPEGCRDTMSKYTRAI